VLALDPASAAEQIRNYWAGAGISLMWAACEGMAAEKPHPHGQNRYRRGLVP
jgi:hypothetical protein